MKWNQHKVDAESGIYKNERIQSFMKGLFLKEASRSMVI